jgi:hypothetical protein
MKRDKSGRFVKSKSKGGGKSPKVSPWDIKERKLIVKKINKLLPLRDKLRPAVDYRINKKTGEFEERHNKTKNQKYVKVHNEIRLLRKKIYSYVEPKLRVDTKGAIHQIKGT